MIAPLRRCHRWLEERQASFRVRLAVTAVLVLATGAAGWQVVSVASSLASQQSGIVAALASCSAKKQDPAAMQLLGKGTVTANGRDYGGLRQIPRPADLFDDEGEMQPATRRDLAWRLVADQVPAWVPAVLVRSESAAWLAALAAVAVPVAIVWAGLAVLALELGSAFAGLFAIFAWAGFPLLAQGVVAAALALLLQGFLWRGTVALLAGRSGTVAVARLTVLEGIRTLAGPAFVVPVAVCLPLLALSRDPAQALYLAIPGFLDWGHTVVYSCAALLAIFFGCATTSFEVRDRQVWSVLTKPVSRIGWLLGKWMGTVALSAAVLAGGGVLLGIGAQFLASQRPVDERDARDVRDTVLVGRVGTMPEYEYLPPDRLRDAVQQAIDADAVLKAELANGTRDDAATRRDLAVERQKQHLESQRRIMQGQSKDFAFRGLGAAARAGLPMQLRYKMHAGVDDPHERFPMIIEFRSGEVSGQWIQREWVPTESYSLDIEPRMIDADGTLRIRIIDAVFDDRTQKFMAAPLPIFVDADGMEVMAAQSTFAQNLLAAFLVDLCKIAFLASLAVVSGSMLSFPIAVLLAFGTFSMATLTPFLANSLRDYVPDAKSGAVIWAFQSVVRAIAVAIEFLLRGFAARSPSDALAQGRAITAMGVAEAFLSIGLAWAGGVLALGWAAIRRKEIAVYSGQG